MTSLAANQLPLAPLGAGDLIDRAVRLYRRHFSTLIRIAAPPVVISAAGGVVMSIGWRAMTATSRESSLAVYVLMLLVGIVLLVGGTLLNVIVMGGAARNLVAHLLWDEPVTARSTYSNALSRFWGLLASTIIIGVIVSLALSIIFYVVVIVLSIIAIGVFMLGLPDWLAGLFLALAILTVILGGLWLFFLVAGRFAYVPQVMLVEGRGVFASLARSASLATRNVKRLMAMVFFSLFSTYSALMILLVPLGWYGYLNGIDPFQLKSEAWPAWYAISYEVVVQLSSILITPVWMLGLSLLYVDERVRQEGYDIELMASRRLGEIPMLRGGQAAPIAPALVSSSDPPGMVSPMPFKQTPTVNRDPNSTLGLR